MKAALLVLFLSGAATAQNRTTLVDAPLSVLLPMAENEVPMLQSEFRQLLAQHSALLLPTRSSWNSAVAAVGRKDCDVNDECLQQLAQASTSLYALFASIEGDPAGTVLRATGRVVDRQGRLVRAKVQVTNAASGPVAAQLALRQLLFELELDQLSSSPPIAGVNTPASPPSPVRIAAWVTLGAAIGAAGSSLGFGLTALPVDGQFTTGEQRRATRSAMLSLGTGLGAAALLATSLVLFSTSGPVTLLACPTAGGGVVVARGQF